MKKLSAILVPMALSGCSAFTPPMNKPIIEDHVHAGDHKVNTFSVIPSRRMVIVGSDNSGSTPNGDRVVVCAEASADVTDNLVSTLAASAAASGPTGKSSAEISAGIQQTLATTAQFLFRRSQGIQLYRDSMYHLCQARMNGYVTNDEYKDRARSLLDASVKLIEQEIPRLQPVANPPPAPVTINLPSVGTKAGSATATVAGTEIKMATQPTPKLAAGDQATAAGDSK